MNFLGPLCFLSSVPPPPRPISRWRPAWSGPGWISSPPPAAPTHWSSCPTSPPTWWWADRAWPPGREARDVPPGRRSGPGRPPPVVVIGGPEGTGTDTPAVAGEDYLPADVGAAELVDHICVKRSRQPAAARHRSAVTEQRLDEEISRELQRAELAGRPGVLAVVKVAELPRLRERLGPQAEQAITAAFDELFAWDGQILEVHSARSGGGFWLLMPEPGQAAARSRLLRLSRRV